MFEEYEEDEDEVNLNNHEFQLSKEDVSKFTVVLCSNWFVQVRVKDEED